MHCISPSICINAYCRFSFIETVIKRQGNIARFVAKKPIIDVSVDVYGKGDMRKNIVALLSNNL